LLLFAPDYRSLAPADSWNMSQKAFARHSDIDFCHKPKRLPPEPFRPPACMITAPPPAITAMTECADHSAVPEPDARIGIARKNPFDAAAFERAVADLLAACGIAADTQHMGRTAERVRTLWQRRLLGGYDMDPAEALGEGFEDPRRDMVVVRGIAVHGVCPHHLVPFRGVAHVAYLPGGRLHGFGRIARMVDAIGHRFTYQEWMTRDIAEALVTHGKAAGGACIVEAEQLCLLLGEDRRGDERVVTQSFTGAFEKSDQLRTEFLRAISGRLP